jgi:hypothetical protein
LGSQFFSDVHRHYNRLRHVGDLLLPAKPKLYAMPVPTRTTDTRARVVLQPNYQRQHERAMSCKHERHPGHCMLPVLVVARKGTALTDGECAACPHFNLAAPVIPYPVSPAKYRGLGDVVAKVLRLVGIGKRKPCGGCKARQAALNRILPFS